MDSARFIRKKSVLAAWLAVPLLLALIAEFGAAGFREHQQVSYMRAVMLEQLLPRMQAEARHFGAFIKDYEKDAPNGASVEDIHLAFCNEAARRAEFIMTSMSVTKEPVDGALGIARVTMDLKGFGSGREVANFFKHLKNKDPLIYEEKVWLTRTVKNMDRLQVEAVLSKVYTERGRGDRL